MSNTVGKGLLMRKQMRNEVITTVASFALIAFAAGARADVDDPDIFTLISPINDEVYVCGTTDCGDGVHIEGGDATTRTAGDGYALFSIYEVGPTGSGYINPFLRFQHNEQSGNGNDTVETAYNTNNDDLQRLSDPTHGPGAYDYENQAKDTVAGGWKDGDFNRAILYSDLIDEDGYFTFLLDINEPNSEDKSTLRLDELSFFISTSDMLGIYNPDCTSGESDYSDTSGSAGCFEMDDNAGAWTEKVWDMDLDKIIGATMLDNENAGTAGSGDYDLKVQLPTDIFTAYIEAHPDQELYVYLENTAGATDDYLITGSDGEVAAGFEEWAYVGKPQNVPVPGTVLLTGLGLLLLSRRVRS